MMIEFDGTVKPTGLEVYDPIEQRRLHVKTPVPVSPQAASDDRFCFPVDTACAVETESLVFDQLYSVYLRDEAGQPNQKLEASERATFGEDDQFIELSGPIKVYCRIDSPGAIETGIDSIHITFDQPTTVTIGARSLHEQPAATIYTPDDPESIMQAVSALSSALKTTSPERSWPTLRGHPPLIERGPELEIPDELEHPETDVTIEVPPTYQNIYAVSPLAFYLGAEIRSGEDPAIVTDLATYELGVGTRLEDDVADTLKHVFLLDCIVRMDGLYRYDLYERTELEADLPFNLWETYQLSLPERLERYLSVPFELVEPHIPRWPLTAHVPSTYEGVELLPFVINELGIVREPRGELVEADVQQGVSGTERAGAQLVRSETDVQQAVSVTERASAQFVRSAETYRSPVFESGDDDSLDIVEPAVTDESIEHAWFGSHVPRRASKATLESFQSQLAREKRNESIEILLVCNDVRMLEEHDVLGDTYGTRETLPFDIDSEFGVSSDRLATLLTEGGYDFLHYIGHATPTGLKCTDGELDVRTLESVDLGVFFLNACQSYEQGLAMAKRGAFGGVGTLGDIVNEHAVEMGETIARLLNLGFPLRGALELARETTVLGEQYIIVGDGSADIAQTDGGAPTIVELAKSGDIYDIVFRTYPTKEFQVGTTGAPNIDVELDRHLCPRNMQLPSVEYAELNEYLMWTDATVLFENDLVWNESLSPIGLL